MNVITKIVEHKATEVSPAEVHPPSNAVSLFMAGVSPAKSAELRMKNLERLRYLKKLFNDGIICENELVEQKKIVLEALKKLS